MTLTEINKFITENLISNGNLISKRCRVEWFNKIERTDVYNSIFTYTSFLPNSATFTQRMWHIYNNIFTIVVCEHDKKTPVQFKSFKYGYYDFASSSNSNKSALKKDKIKESNFKKYGVQSYTQSDDFKEKAKETWIDKYGVDNPSKSKLIKNKKIETCKSNYGVEWPQQADEVRERGKITNIERYGVENPMMSDMIRRKTSKTRCEIEYDRFFDNPSFSDRLIPLFDITDYNGVNNSYSFMCKRCNIEFEDVLRGGKIPRCYNCYPNNNTSVAEIEIGDYIQNELRIDVIRNDRVVLGGTELDIYLPELKMAIEYNGLYYHSELNGGKDKNYHLNKTNECKSRGIRLIHIFEDEWLEKQDIVKRRLKHILGKDETKLWARKCEVREINSTEASGFLTNTHIQGNTSSSVKLGIFHKNELMGVMTFSKRKIFNTTDDWELVRFSTKNTIVGGFGKLLKFFEKKYSPKTIITYALRRWSGDNNNVYLKNGFTQSGNIYPGFYYTKSGHRFNRINFQKHKLKDKLEKFDPNLTEWENMQLNGYDRIWDCGNLKYIKNY